jgi:hypothetical protein
MGSSSLRGSGGTSGYPAPRRCRRTSFRKNTTDMKRLPAMFALILLPAYTTVAQHVSVPQKAEELPVTTQYVARPAVVPDAVASVYTAFSSYRYPSGTGPLAGAQPDPLPEVPYSRKSPVLAGALSLLIPGAGQVYAESYWTAALFATLEAVGWYVVVDQHAKGDEATTTFERYADDYWSVVNYAEWLNTWATTFPGGEDSKQITISDDATRVPWERVNWAEMNEVEIAIPQFSHKLPPHGDQQYFEMIGKYNQYSSGWVDYSSGRDYYSVSPRFLEYAGLRGDANKHYDNADTFLNLIIINHVLAAAEAAWAAARFNKFVELYSHTRLRNSLDGRLVVEPSVGFAMRF